jgi:hypothetical protein
MVLVELRVLRELVELAVAMARQERAESLGFRELRETLVVVELAGSAEYKEQQVVLLLGLDLG